VPQMTSLKLRRLGLGLLAVDVAKRAGIGRSRYSMIENNWVQAKPAELEAIEEVLAAGPTQACGVPEPEPEPAKVG